MGLTSPFQFAMAKYLFDEVEPDDPELLERIRKQTDLGDRK